MHACVSLRHLLRKMRLHYGREGAPCGVERLRNLVADHAARAGLRPEIERPGLLIPGRPDDSHLSRRRAAGVFLTNFFGGFPVALDFAVTAPQRRETLTQAAG